MSRLARGFFIVWVIFRYGLDELVLNSFQHPVLSRIARFTKFGLLLTALVLVAALRLA